MGSVTYCALAGTVRAPPLPPLAESPPNSADAEAGAPPEEPAGDLGSLAEPLEFIMEGLLAGVVVGWEGWEAGVGLWRAPALNPPLELLLLWCPCE
jgi:hypothetical protein